jgi:purine-binding chemotaxis protein CheW
VDGNVKLAIDVIKENIVQVVGFYVGQKLYGADIMTVQEILRNPTIDAFDEPSDFIAGMINLRGQKIPALDLNKRIGKSVKPGDGGDRWILIAQVGDQMVGLIADAVTRIFRIKSDSILPAPEMILSAMESPYVVGVCESDLGMLVVLDLTRFLTGDEIKALKAMDKP